MNLGLVFVCEGFAIERVNPVLRNLLFVPQQRHNFILFLQYFFLFYLYSERDFLVMVLLLVVLNLIHVVSQSFKLLFFLKNELFPIFSFKLCQCKF